MDTLMLDTALDENGLPVWDLMVDANGNIAVATGALALAQDAASAIKTFLGECYWDTTIGVPWLQQILGRPVSLALLKQQLVDAALTVPGVASAVVYISGFSNRSIAGQVQVVSATTGQIGAANFSVINPQGTG
jgi:hypothetical protein